MAVMLEQNTVQDEEMGLPTVIERAAAIYRAIQEAMGSMDEAERDPLGTVGLPLSVILYLLPAKYRRPSADGNLPRDKVVPVLVDNLFDQLALGRVAIPLARLLFAVPPRMVAGEALKDQTPVELPLAAVVAGVEPHLFRERITGKPCRIDTDKLPDLFVVHPGQSIRAAPRAAPTPWRAAPIAPTAAGPSLPSNPPTEPAVRPGPRASGAVPRAPDSSAVPAGDPAATIPPPAAEVRPVVVDVPPAPAPVGDKTAVEEKSVQIALALSDILDLVRERHAANQALSGDDGARKVPVVIENLLGQLGRGRVAIPTAQLVLAVPPWLLPPAARVDQHPVNLPLPLVVNAVDPGLLATRPARPAKDRNISGLPDFFRLGPESAGLPAAPPAVAEGLPPAAADGPPPAAAASPEPLTATENFGGVDRLGGVNLNTATIEQLVTLDGVAEAVGRSILKYREQHGLFRDVFDLAEVPRVGRRTFKAITGMPWSAKRHHRRERLATLLDIPVEQSSHLPTVARALASRRGLGACVIANEEGFLLAAHGADAFANSLAAMLPGLVQAASERAKECLPDPLESISVRLGGRMITVVPSGNIYLAAVHEVSRLTLGQLRLIERVAREVAWLVGRRGYVAA